MITQIIELSKKYKEVNAYYEFSLNPDIGARKEKVKEAILECFYPKRGYKLRLRDARKVISDFKKLSPDDESLIDVMIYYVECSVEFTNDYGDINEPFYNSIAGMFHGACKLVDANGLAYPFKERAENIMNDTS